MAFKPLAYINQAATDALKRQIKQKQLIDTGLMYDSTYCMVEIDEFGVMTVEIYSTEYLKFLFDEWTLYQFTTDRNGWVNAAYKQWTAWKVKQNPMLNWKVPNPKVTFDFMN